MSSNQELAWEKLALYGLHAKPNHLGFNKYAGKNGTVTHISLVDGATVIRVWPAGSAAEGLTQVQTAQPKRKPGRPAKLKAPSKKERLAALKPGERLEEKGGYWICLPSGIATWIQQVA